MEHLIKMDKNDKAVVFSQFLGMLDLLEHDLKKNKIKFVVILYPILRECKVQLLKNKEQKLFVRLVQILKLKYF